MLQVIVLFLLPEADGEAAQMIGCCAARAARVEMAEAVQPDCRGRMANKTSKASTRMLRSSNRPSAPRREENGEG